MSNKPFPPQHLTILTPIKSTISRVGNEGNAMPTVMFRMMKDDLAVVDAGAKALGIPRSQFIRWVLWQAANQVVAAKRQSGKA